MMTPVISFLLLLLFSPEALGHGPMLRFVQFKKWRSDVVNAKTSFQLFLYPFDLFYIQGLSASIKA